MSISGMYKHFPKSLFVPLVGILLLTTCEEPDVTPPIVSIQSPISGQTVSEIVTISISTRDNMGILKVEFYIDDSLHFTDMEQPFKYLWNTTTYEDSSEHIVKVISYDLSENYTESQPILLIVDNSNFHPNPVNILTVTVSQNPSKITVTWEESPDDDFDYYTLLYSQSQSGDTEIIATISSKSVVSYIIADMAFIDPTYENWFWVRVTDTLGLSSMGNGFLYRLISVPAHYPTIQAAIDAADEGNTILVHPGTYLENINFRGKNVILGSLFFISSDTNYISQTVIDGGGNYGSLVTFSGGEDSNAVLIGFTLANGYAGDGGGIYCLNSNPTLMYLVVTGNTATSAAGIFCWNSSPILSNVEISNNSTSGIGYGRGGGGIYCFSYSSPRLTNVTISNNSSHEDGGGIYIKSYSNPVLTNVMIVGNSCNGGSHFGSDGGGVYLSGYSRPVFTNVTIADNSADNGGGVYIDHGSDPNLVNTIMWDNLPEELYFFYPNDPSSITVSYSDIRGGEKSIVTNSNGTVNWFNGNINADPLFKNPASKDFHLQEDSPCIDAGNPDTQYNDLDGSRNDMGTYGGPKGN